MGRCWSWFKQSLANEYQLPSYEDPAAQSVRNMAVYATVVEVAAFMLMAIPMISDHLFWEPRCMTYLCVFFMGPTVLYSLHVADKVAKEPSEEGKAALVKKGRLFAVAIVATSIAIGIMVYMRVMA